MNWATLLKRGVNLVKVGQAVRTLKSATDEDKHQWAKNYLLQVLGESRGLPAKVGQFMTLESEDEALRETLNSSIRPMPFDQVVSLLEERLESPFDSVFRGLDKEGKAASLGQVHFGKLRDGTAVAVKVQYPEIARAVEAEMDLLGWMPKVGPAAKWGFHLDGYRDAFWNSFRKELDYTCEIRHQQRYRELVRPLKNVIVPEVLPAYCRSKVLVQRLEEGFGLDKAEKMVSPQRQAMGRILLEHYFHMLFRHGFVHSDPHPGNFAFRRYGRDNFALILYDYGSILEVPDEVRLGLLRIILALQDHEPLDPVSCLTLIGFDAEKLHDLRPTLPALLNVLFDPFVTDAPYNVAEWRMSERFDQIVGEMKWWFRSAAPPALIFMMRTLHGLAVMLERLDARLPWRYILDRSCAEEYASVRSLTVPEPSVAPEKILGFDGMARYLKVSVVKPNGNKVKLTMPARVAENLKDVIDPPVKEAIGRQGIDLDDIQRRARKSGFVRQTLFDLKDPERHVRVWLE
ncbi:MAG: ABC1 kinase family protein [Nitrospinaceae bacterium]